MNVKETKDEATSYFNYEDFHKKSHSICLLGLKQLKKIIRSHIFFHLFFIGLLIAEIFIFSIFLAFLAKSALIAFSLAGIILTAFGYLISLFYFQVKKSEQFIALRNYFMHLCEQKIPKTLGVNERHLSLANVAYRFADHLNPQEIGLSGFPPSPHSINKLIRKFSHFCLDKDLQKMKEIFLLISITEHIQLIKKNPTDIEAHASLANAYIVLSRIYLGKNAIATSKEYQEKFQNISKKAIQEFKILDHYSPNDPWVQAQLASCYHDLKMFKKEICCYEKILKLCPNDKQILFRLGILYFQQDLNAQGLEIYETLKAMNFSRIDELIDYYGFNLKENTFIN